MAQGNLLHRLVYPLRLVKLLAILRHEGRTHIDAIEPHLVRIAQLMPVSAHMCSRMVAQLLDEAFYCPLILSLACGLVDGKEHLTRVDEVDIVCLGRIEVYLTLLVDQRVGPLMHIVIISVVACGLPHAQHGHAAHTL